MGEEDGNALLVTELVDGATLAQLNRDGALSDREIGEIGADLCEALDHAHSRARRPPRHQAAERARHRGRRAAGEADGLRRRPAHRRRRADRARRRRRHPRLHGARAGRGPRRRPRGRRLLAGADALRVLERREPEPPLDPGRDGAGDRRPHAAAAPAAPRPAARADRRRSTPACSPPRSPPVAGGAGRRRSRTRSTASPTSPAAAARPVACASARSPPPRPSGAWLAAGHGVLLP